MTAPLKTLESPQDVAGQSLAASPCSLSLVPCTISAAKHFVAKLHRHNKPPQGGLFAVGAACGGELVAVAIIGRPVARNLDDGKTCEVIRLCTDGSKNACSILYGAAARAAKALGWQRIVTYILASEPGTSLRAGGWMLEKEVPAEASWSRRSRPRMQTDLFGEEQRPACGKQRWARILSANKEAHQTSRVEA
jgi:hypothetical protein